MDFTDCIQYLSTLGVDYKTYVNLASMVSIRVGGVGALCVYPNNIENYIKVLNFLYSNKYKFFILGNGTNTYFSSFYDGVIISTNLLKNIKAHNNEILALCGASLTQCAVMAYENCLSGLEFSYGIPGSVGGAVYMNANAFGGNISDILLESRVYDLDNNSVKYLSNSEHNFSEKNSIFQEKRYIILESKFMLSTDSKENIIEKMNTYKNIRIKTQPLNEFNAGSVFKRTDDIIPARLIDELGLKGCSINDAQISTKHAGFIINKNKATANDINSLIKLIKSKVKEAYDIELKEEIIYVE